jgi:hypothetical protein
MRSRSARLKASKYRSTVALLPVIRPMSARALVLAAVLVVSPGCAVGEPAPRACRSVDLQLAIDDRQPVPPTGQRPLRLRLANRSAVSCFLFGYPGVALLDAGGRELPFAYRQGSDQVVAADAPVRVEVVPGGAAHATINKYRCDLLDLGEPTTLRLTPPGETTALELALPPSLRVTLAYCGPGEPGSTVSVSPVASSAGEALRGHRRANPQTG